MFGNYEFKEINELHAYSCEGCIFHRDTENKWHDYGCYAPNIEPFKSCKTRKVVFVDLGYVSKEQEAIVKTPKVVKPVVVEKKKQEEQLSLWDI